MKTLSDKFAEIAMTKEQADCLMDLLYVVDEIIHGENDKASLENALKNSLITQKRFEQSLEVMQQWLEENYP